MNTNNKHPHFSRTVLHNGEERVKRIFRDQLAELAGLLEVGISLLVVVALMLAVVPLIKMLPGLLVDTNEVEISLFLQRALDIVIGIEFIKMLAKHSPGSALEVLLYAIARHMIVGHESAVENFISVASIALIFFVRKFLFVPAFGATMPGVRHRILRRWNNRIRQGRAKNKPLRYKNKNQPKQKLRSWAFAFAAELFGILCKFKLFQG